MLFSDQIYSTHALVVTLSLTTALLSTPPCPPSVLLSSCFLSKKGEREIKLASCFYFFLSYFLSFPFFLVPLCDSALPVCVTFHFAPIPLPLLFFPLFFLRWLGFLAKIRESQGCRGGLPASKNTAGSFPLERREQGWKGAFLVTFCVWCKNAQFRPLLVKPTRPLSHSD